MPAIQPHSGPRMAPPTSPKWEASFLRSVWALKLSTSISPSRSPICHKSYATCILSHVSGDDPNAFDSRTDISADMPTFSFTMSSSAWRLQAVYLHYLSHLFRSRDYRLYLQFREEVLELVEVLVEYRLQGGELTIQNFGEVG